jgi:hypothetical protein
MVIGEPLVVIGAPVLSNVVPALLNPPGDVTAPFRSAAPPFMIEMEFAARVEFEVTPPAALLIVSVPSAALLPTAPLNRMLLLPAVRVKFWA